jgi:FkbM family methyltransferase
MKKVAKFFQLLFRNHPLLAAKIRRRIFSNRFKDAGKGIVQFGEVRFSYDPELDPCIQDMVSGDAAEEVIQLMRRHLKPGDTFLDVGSNIGAICAEGLRIVGKRGSVHGFEPVPAYFARLEELKKLNPDYKLTINNCALGERCGTAQIAVAKRGNIGWNTMVPGFMESDNILETIDIPVQRLDDYLLERSISDVKFIKIDTEGFEYPVLLGLSNYFATCKRKPYIVCEVAPSAIEKLGCTMRAFEKYICDQGYRILTADTLSEVSLGELTRTIDVFFEPKE